MVMVMMMIMMLLSIFSSSRSLLRTWLRTSAMGPAAISGYVSPVPLGIGARATAAGPLPRPTAAQMAAQDPQTRDPRLAAREH